MHQQEGFQHKFEQLLLQVSKRIQEQIQNIKDIDLNQVRDDLYVLIHMRCEHLKANLSKWVDNQLDKLKNPLDNLKAYKQKLENLIQTFSECQKCERSQDLLEQIWNNNLDESYNKIINEKEKIRTQLQSYLQFYLNQSYPNSQELQLQFIQPSVVSIIHSNKVIQQSLQTQHQIQFYENRFSPTSYSITNIIFHHGKIITGGFDGAISIPAFNQYHKLFDNPISQIIALNGNNLLVTDNFQYKIIHFNDQKVEITNISTIKGQQIHKSEEAIYVVEGNQIQKLNLNLEQTQLLNFSKEILMIESNKNRLCVVYGSDYTLYQNDVEIQNVAFHSDYISGIVVSQDYVITGSFDLTIYIYPLGRVIYTESQALNLKIIDDKLFYSNQNYIFNQSIKENENEDIQNTFRICEQLQQINSFVISDNQIFAVGNSEEPKIYEITFDQK